MIGRLDGPRESCFLKSGSYTPNQGFTDHGHPLFLRFGGAAALDELLLRARRRFLASLAETKR